VLRLDGRRLCPGSYNRQALGMQDSPVGSRGL